MRPSPWGKPSRARAPQSLPLWCVPVFVTLAVALAAAAGPPLLLPDSFPDQPTSGMQMLLEKTLFQVNVLSLEVRLGTQATGELAALIEARPPEEALVDSIASVAMHAQDAWAHIEFRRGVGLHRFLKGIDQNMQRARAAGIISQSAYDEVSQGLPRWFAFLEQGGLQRGDELFYRVHGDTLRTVFRAVDGTVRLDQVDVGPERRLTLLGSYFVTGSDFREPLVRSLLDAVRTRGRP